MSIAQVPSEQPHRLSSDSSEDKDLTLAFQRGDNGAYDVIYARYAPRVQSVCRRILGRPDEAQEASQETFIRVYEALGKFNGRYQLGAWITRIATNVCLDHLRTQGRRPAIRGSLEVLDIDPVDASEDLDPERLVIRRAEGRRVRKVLASLPPMHRAAIVLRDFEGLSYEEIATALSITESQTKALIHRARQGFKRSWSHSGVAVLLPWRLLQRVRRADALRETTNAGQSLTHVAEVASPTFQQSLSTCSAVLQQCGQFMSERLAPTVAAVLVGSATVGAAASPPSEPVHQVAHVQRPDDIARPQPIQKKERRKTRPAPVAAPVEEPAPPVEAEPQPEPAPDPEPTKPPSQEPPKDNGGKETPPSPTPPPPTTVAVSFAGYPQGPTLPSSATATVDCANTSVTTDYATTIVDDEGSYPARIRVTIAATVSIELTITKNGTDYTYNGGASGLTKSRSAQELTMSFAGSYSRIGNNQPGNVSLPESGRFDGAVSLDCAASHVTTENITFSLG